MEALNTRLRDDPFLGKGTIAVTEIRSLSPSLCAVPGACSIHLDRRLTAGETKESAVAEVKALPGAEDAEMEILNYDMPSYTGLRYPMEKYYPTWVLEENHPLAQAAVTHLCGLARQAAGGGQVDVQHQRRGLHGIDGRADHRLRAGRRGCGAQRDGARAHPPPGGSGPVLRGVSADVCKYSGSGYS